jgi:site-specific DNA recombinase
VNAVLDNHPRGYTHDANKENENIPLKRFLICAECGASYTGYLNKKKNIYYYKCNKIGCRCNRNAKAVHLLFANVLDRIKLKPAFISLLKERLKKYFMQNESSLETKRMLEEQLKEIDGKVGIINERYATGEITKEVYLSTSAKMQERRKEVAEKLNDVTFKIIRLHSIIEMSYTIAQDFRKVWENGDFSKKQRIQKLIFERGLKYLRRADQLSNIEINPFMELKS